MAPIDVKQLHLANIANVAYGYAKILREVGAAADVLCYDLTHILSLPMWVDGDFEISVADEWHPPQDHPDLQRVRLPEWYRRIRSRDYWVSSRTVGRSLLLSREWADAIVQASQRYGPRWTLTREDVLSYRPLVDALQASFFTGYDVIFGYAYGAVPPLLASLTPYVAVEIGTLRDTVNIDTPLGRLLALAYRNAPFTIVTNADCRAAAEALELESYSFVPHPVDEDVFKPLGDDERLAIRNSLCASRHLLVAPARQSWNVKANHRYLHAFAELVRGGADATLLISEWGPDVRRAKRLIADLGIADRVKWFAPAPERRLARMFAAADLILDQFGTFGTFGLIGPKAMACATPCLLSFDPALHAWCFAETPPVVGVGEEHDLLQAMQHYLTDEPARVARGAQSRQWMLRHHSKAIVAQKMQEIVSLVSGASRPKAGFDALRRQKLALRRVPQAVPGPEAVRLVAGRWRSVAAHLRRLPARVGRTLNGLRTGPPARLRPARLKADACIGIDAALGRLQATAPLNWDLYLGCLNRGAQSHKAFPPSSPGTPADPETDLFCAFLRPYVRGQVLDIGYRPQPVARYLGDHPIERTTSLGPVSGADDRPFRFVPGVGEYLPWDNSQFDVVVSAASLDRHYLLDLATQSAFRVLRPGGHLVASIIEFPGAPSYDPYTTRMAHPYDGEHLFRIDRTWFLPLMAQTGFREVEILALQLPHRQLFMSFEKPALGSRGARESRP